MITEEQGVVDTTAALPMSQITAINGTEQRAMVILDAVDETSYEWPRMSPPGPETLTISTTISQSISAAPDRYKQSPSSTHASTKLPQGWERFDSSSTNSSCHQAKLLSPKQTPTYGPDRPETVDQSDQRKRPCKNRTRTGCMTCRRRRTKCDEKRPECNNCLRGGRICIGPQLLRWRVPVAESEDKSSGDAQAPHQFPGAGPQECHDYTREPLHVGPKHASLLGVANTSASDLRTPSAQMNSPANYHRPAISPAHQLPTPSDHARLHQRSLDTNEHARPRHELSWQEPRQDFAVGTPQSAQSINQARLPLQTSSEPSYPTPQAIARLALSRLTPRSRQRSQKGEMLAGRPYFPFDRELVLERERCDKACWRFNNSTNPCNGVSPQERARLFRDIFETHKHVFSSTEASSVLPLSRVGDNVVIKCPFTCDYGYNITIGQDVEIGSGCIILDACEVKIGDRCNIGPNVSIYTTSPPAGFERLGSKGPSIGAKVTIDPDCWIAGGVTILPGRRIGQGSTVGACSVVTRDVPPYTVACGNPARVIKGVTSLPA